MKNNTRESVIFIILLIIIGFVTYEFKSNKDKKQSEINSDETTKLVDKKADYQSEIEINKNDSIKDNNYKSITSDKNVLLLSGDIDVTIDNIKIDKYGDTLSNNNCKEYGINSSILANSITNLKIMNSTINTEAIGAYGIFSNNSKIIINNIVIDTKKDYSYGVVAKNDSNVTISDGNVTTNGLMSPVLYSLSNIEVNNSKLIANHSESIIIEGKHSIVINDSEIISTNDYLFDKATTYNNILLYQPFNNDATNDDANLIINNSIITTNKGDTIYVTNTEANIELNNNTFINNDNGYFIRIEKSKWGIDDLNGGVVNLKLDNQKLIGDIAVDKISVLNINLTNQSYYEGIINGNNTGAKIELVLDKKSKIKLMGDSYITSINDTNRAYTNIDFNGYKLYVDGTSLN